MDKSEKGRKKSCQVFCLLAHLLCKVDSQKSEMLVYCRLKLGRNNSEKSLKTYFQQRDCVLVKTIERRVIIQSDSVTVS